MATMTKIALILVLMMSFTESSFAVVRRTCKVQYQTDYGWSQEYTMQVEFMTGSELNKATRSYSYDSYKKYCLLWFSNGGVAINEIKTYFLCGLEFDDDAFRNLFAFHFSIECEQINSHDDEVPVWKIAGKSFSGDFVDPRDN
jgi:hypothetical protein